MLFSIIVALMVLLVAMYYVYQGCFSALIMFFEAVVAAAIAFNYYEGVHDMWKDSISPGIGYPLALMGLFVVLLAVMKTVTDKVIPGNVTMPVMLDRAGGFVGGFFAGLVMVGTSLIAVQMLPIGSDIIGFERLAVNDDGFNERKSFYLKPDNFAAWMVGNLSGGAMSGSNPFNQAKPDILMDLYAARCVTQTEDRHVIPADAVTVVSMRDGKRIDDATHSLIGNALKRDFKPAEAPEGRKFLICKVRVKTSANRDKGSDIRFRLPQFRIFGPPPENANARPQAYMATGMSDLYMHNKYNLMTLDKAQVGRLVRFNSESRFILEPGLTAAVAVQGKDLSGTDVVSGYEFDVAFEVPEDFKPWYLEFKRGARFDLTRMKAAAPGSVPEQPVTPAGDSSSTTSGGSADSSTPSEPTVGEAPKGRTNVAYAVTRGTKVSSVIPIPLDLRNGAVRSASRGDKFAEGHVVVDVPTEKLPQNEEVTAFLVPSDMQMVQIGWEPNYPQSMFGKALHFAASVSPKIQAIDDQGKEYWAIGIFSEADVNGKRKVEVQYDPSALEGVPERALKKPKELTDRVIGADLRNNHLVYLFLVPSGVNIVAIQINKEKQSITSLAVP